VIRGVVFFLVALLATPALASTRVVDDAGRTLEFSRPPQRIVALTPHLTELLFAVGAGSQVAGVDSASDYPPAARGLPRVGDYSRANLERVLALKPDLVVVWLGGNRAADIHALEQLGLPVLRTRASRLDDVARLLRLLGRASGHAAEGETAARDVSAKLAALAQRYARDEKLPVFYQVWARPLMTVGGGHWISDALAVCGARNIFADLGAASPVVSREAVLMRAPSLILGGSDAPELRHQWRPFTGVPAVRNDAFVRIDADRLHRPTPRLVGGVEELCEAVASYR
jgi:iron complex transport system substrate-binding protein